MTLFKKGQKSWNNGLKGKEYLKHYKNGYSKGMLGKITSEETKQKISLKLKGHKNNLGHKFSDDYKKRMSVIIKELWKNKPMGMTGKHFSEESKKKLALIWKGKKRPELSKNMSGKNHHNWQGGISYEPYGLEFNNQLKEFIRKRDNYRCQECFRHQNELFFELKNNKIKHYKLFIHHIDYNKQNNNPKNLISLCGNCHTQTNYGRNDWIQYFRSKNET